MELRKHVYAVKNILSNGPSSDDYSFTNELIAHILGVVRAVLTERKIDKYHFVSDQSYQDWCATLAEGSYHDCCNVSFDDCKILRSTTTIPSFLNSRWGNYVKVTDLTGRVIPQLDPTQVRYAKYSLVPISTSYFIHNNYLFILSNTKLEKILVNALFQNPQEVQELNCPAGSDNCVEYLDSEFPIDADLVEAMYKMTIEMLIGRTIQDQVNDSNDDKANANVQ